MISASIPEIVYDTLGAGSNCYMLHTASLSYPLWPYSRQVCERVANDSEKDRNDSCETDSDHSKLNENWNHWRLPVIQSDEFASLAFTRTWLLWIDFLNHGTNFFLLLRTWRCSSTIYLDHEINRSKALVEIFQTRIIFKARIKCYAFPRIWRKDKIWKLLGIKLYRMQQVERKLWGLKKQADDTVIHCSPCKVLGILWKQSVYWNYEQIFYFFR